MVFNAFNLENKLSDRHSFWQTLILKICESGNILGANALKN